MKGSFWPEEGGEKEVLFGLCTRCYFEIRTIDSSIKRGVGTTCIVDTRSFTFIGRSLE